MAQVFIEPDAEVEVKMYIGNLKDANKLVADIEKGKLEELYGDELTPNSIEEHTAYFRLPTYFDNTIIAGAAMSISNDGVQINPSVLRLKRLTALVKRWSFKGNDGKPMVPTDRSVAALHPTVATILGMGLEQKLDSLGY